MTVYSFMQMRRRGGTGRHATLRGEWRKPYAFEPHRRYHGYFATRIRSLFMKAYSEQASLTIRRNTRAARPSPESQLFLGRPNAQFTDGMDAPACGWDRSPSLRGARACIKSQCV